MLGKSSYGCMGYRASDPDFKDDQVKNMLFT